MSKLVITLVGTDNRSVGRLNIKLDGLPEDYTVLPEVVLHQFDFPVLTAGIQINGVPDAVAFDERQKP
jgi:hypothetical protein